MSAPALGSVAVVGAGLIGGSVALRMHQLGIRVTVVDPDQTTRELATAAGLPATSSVPDLTGSGPFDLVVLAGPLDRLEASMGDVARSVPDALVVDVGSTKSGPRESAERAGLAGRHVGLHPMAGTEQSGFAGARADLLVGATWVVARPTSEVALRRVPEVVRLVVDTFDAQVVVTDAAEHDRAVALVSHAPHVLANAMLGLVAHDDDGPLARHLAAGSFTDLTRVAGTHPSRTLNMLAENAGPLAGVLDELIDLLRRYRADLDRPREGTLDARLQQVADDAARIRRPDVAWSTCDDLDATLTAAGSQGSSLLVRRSDGRLETAAVEGDPSRQPRL